MNRIERVKKQIKKQLKKWIAAGESDRGSTMVEVIAGFTILVLVLVECMVHLVGVSGEMVKKSQDVQTDVATLNAEMYRKDAAFETLSDVSISLTLDQENTSGNNKAQPVSISLDAALSKYHSDQADLTVYRITKK